MREFDAAVVDIAHQLDTWIQAFPSHRAGLSQHRFNRAQQRPVPMSFQNAPASFNRVVFAVIRRIVSASNMQACIVNEGDQTLHELGAAPVVFRPLVEIDHQS